MAIAALAAALTAAVGSAVAPSSSEAGGSGSPCTGDLTAPGVRKLPGPRLRMGITPAGRAGAIGPPVPLTPIDRGKTLAALHRLRPPGAPFVIGCNRFFWWDGKAGIRRFQRLTRLDTSRGYQVELQLGYHPRPAQEGDIDAWVGFVRRVVRKFGPNPR